MGSVDAHNQEMEESRLEVAVRIWKLEVHLGVVWTIHKPQNGVCVVCEDHSYTWTDVFDYDRGRPREKPKRGAESKTFEIPEKDIKLPLKILLISPVAPFCLTRNLVIDGNCYGIDAGETSPFVLNWDEDDDGWETIRDPVHKVLAIVKAHSGVSPVVSRAPGFGTSWGFSSTAEPITPTGATT